jgi:environmental stress-induced protein Ves
MIMKLIHLKPDNYVVSTWSGGTTTQIGIAPQGAVYADRDFMWRISSATVDLEVSDFTPLPDYDRLISTLEGEIDVTHNGGESIHLAPYCVHSFDGGWETRSAGKCRDFNLMTRKGVCTGRMEAVMGPASVTVGGKPHDTAILYCGVGEVCVQAEGQAVTLKQGEALLLESAEETILTVSDGGRLILTEAWY